LRRYRTRDNIKKEKLEREFKTAAFYYHSVEKSLRRFESYLSQTPLYGCLRHAFGMPSAWITFLSACGGSLFNLGRKKRFYFKEKPIPLLEVSIRVATNPKKPKLLTEGRVEKPLQQGINFYLSQPSAGRWTETKK
jgi:hypothetical protein